MHISIDSNIFIGVLNPYDRLNNESTKLLRNLDKSDTTVLFLCITTEVDKTFRTKATEALKQVFNALQINYSKNLNETAFDIAFAQDVEQIKKADRNLVNFINFVYSEISILIKANEITEAFLRVNTIINDICLTMYATLKSTTKSQVTMYSAINNTDYNQMKGIISIISITETDRNYVLHGAVFSYDKNEKIALFSDDRKLIKSGKKAISLIKQDNNYRNIQVDLSKLGVFKRF